MSQQDYSLTPELQKLAEEIITLAKQKGLTFHPIEFLLLEPEELNAIAACNGFPVKFPHWRWGMNFSQIHQGYRHGASKIYELVINTNPVYAYLMRCNPLVDQKLVMAHVCGHADFFYNNAWFQITNKNMLDQMANNASRIRRITQSISESIVEDFIDTCLSIDNLIDIHGLYVKSKFKLSENDSYEETRQPTPRLPAKNYMENYINTPEFLEEQKKKIEQEISSKKNFPEHPERDILNFLIEHAPLDRWQRDILSIIRNETYYFVPQMLTKVTNEGWACYLHSQLMTEKLLSDSEVVDYCDNHSGVVSMPEGSFNPYKIGLELFRDIEDRWNKGKFGLEWERCDDAQLKKNWNKNLNLGKEKVFQVRKTCNDITFIDEFLTPEFCEKNQLFVYKHLEDSDSYTEATREFLVIKEQLLSQLANGGSPIIELINANFENKGEMLLNHIYDGKELDMTEAEDTMKALYRLWTRPIHLQTITKNREVSWHYDGDAHWITLRDGNPVKDEPTNI